MQRVVESTDVLLGVDGEECDVDEETGAPISSTSSAPREPWEYASELDVFVYTPPFPSRPVLKIERETKKEGLFSSLPPDVQRKVSSRNPSMCKHARCDECLLIVSTDFFVFAIEGLFEFAAHVRGAVSRVSAFVSRRRDE